MGELGEGGDDVREGGSWEEKVGEEREAGGFNV